MQVKNINARKIKCLLKTLAGLVLLSPLVHIKNKINKPDDVPKVIDHISQDEDQMLELQSWFFTSVIPFLWEGAFSE